MKLHILAATAVMFGLASLPAFADNHAHHHEAPACGAPMGEGVLDKFDIKRATATLTHAPIDALDWPEMTMSFKVAKGVDLSAFAVGDRVHFLLKPLAKGNGHELVALCNLDAPAGLHDACMSKMHKTAQMQATKSGETCPMESHGTHGHKPAENSKSHSGHSGH